MRNVQNIVGLKNKNQGNLLHEIKEEILHTGKRYV